MAEHVVDINCDAGESFGEFRIGADDEVMAFASSVNVACGFHGGDPRVIEQTVNRAKELGVAVGAHPGFPDLVGFGRRDLSLTADEARTDTLYQLGALSAFTRAAGVQLRHVKPHGQLNNLAVTDAKLAGAIVAAVSAFDPKLILVAYAGELIREGERWGLGVAREAFADREYRADGRLVSRREPNAVIRDVDRIVDRAISMVKTRTVEARDRETVELSVDTICVHSDTPGAGEIVRALRAGLESAGIAVRPLFEWFQDRNR